MMTAVPDPEPHDTPAFRHEAAEVLTCVRDSFADLLATLPILCERPEDLRRGLRVSTKLAWQAHTIARQEEPLLVAEHVPGDEGVNILLAAARLAGASADVLERVRRAVAGFHSFVRSSADSRRAFEMMLSGLSVRGRERADLRHRRGAFEANGYLFGVQADVQVKSDFFRLSSSAPETMELVTLRGFVGLKRLRPDLPCPLANSVWTTEAGATWESTTRPLLPLTEGQRDILGDAAMPEFCSPDLPPVQRIAREDGSFDFELTPADIGNRAQVDWMMGEFRSRPVGDDQGRPVTAPEPVTRGGLAVRLFTPCKMLVFDNFIHESMFSGCRPRLVMRSDLRGPGSALPDADDRRSLLPVLEEPESLGCGSGAAGLPEAPRYAAAVRSVFAETGWDPAEFNLYRVIMRYPPIPATALLWYASDEV